MIKNFPLVILHENHIQWLSTSWHNSDFDGILRVHRSFFACYSLLPCFNSGSNYRIHVSSIATIHCNILSPPSIYLFKFTGNIYTFVFFTHRAAIFSHLQNSMNWPVTYVQLMSNFITWMSSVIVQQFCNIFHISPVISDKFLLHRCLLLTVFRLLVNCFTYRLMKLYGSTNSESTSTSAVWISIALLQRLTSVLIHVICSSRVSVNAPSVMTVLQMTSHLSDTM